MTKKLFQTAIYFFVATVSLAQQNLMSKSQLKGISKEKYDSKFNKEWVKNALYDFLDYNYTSVGKYGVFLQSIDNTDGDRPIYIHSYKVFTYGNNILYNSSILKNEDGSVKNKGALILNREELSKTNWAVPVGKKMNVLTTAEYVSNAEFQNNWQLDEPYTSSDGRKYWHPNYRVDNSVDLTNQRQKPDYDAEFKTIILCDYDNDLNTIEDNFIFVAGSRIIITK